MKKLLTLILLSPLAFAENETVNKLGDSLSHYECYGELFSESRSGLPTNPSTFGNVALSIYAGQGTKEVDGKDFAFFLSSFPTEWGFRTLFFGNPPEFDKGDTTYVEDGYLTKDEYYWLRTWVEPENGVKERTVSLKFNARFKTFTYQKLSMLDNRYVKSQREYVNGKCELTKKSFNYKYDE